MVSRPRVSPLIAQHHPVWPNTAETLQTAAAVPDANSMHDCFVCALPAGVQGEFTYNEEAWVTVLCANGHWIVIREHELPASLT